MRTAVSVALLLLLVLVCVSIAAGADTRAARRASMLAGPPPSSAARDGERATVARGRRDGSITGHHYTTSVACTGYHPTGQHGVECDCAADIVPWLALGAVIGALMCLPCCIWGLAGDNRHRHVQKDGEVYWRNDVHFDQ